MPSIADTKIPSITITTRVALASSKELDDNTIGWFAKQSTVNRFVPQRSKKFPHLHSYSLLDYYYYFLFLSIFFFCIKFTIGYGNVI
jgi:hypothetical protein